MENESNCDICTEKYTPEKRKKITCSGCEMKCCRECVRKYLTNDTMIADPHCMGCRLGWSQSLVYEAVGKTFVTKDINSHRRKILLERNRANIPAVQEYALARRDVPKLEEEYNTKRSEFEAELRLKRKEWIEANAWRTKEITRLRRIIDPRWENRERGERAKFIHKCSNEGCEGFLSSAWKCGVCNTYTCMDCGKNKGTNTEDRENVHECIREDVESFTLIKSQCKPCPNCATQIYKIEGCDQMWCTVCNTPFSWRTGQRINGGTIHNPHYFEWARRQGGGQMHRQPGDIVCGNEVDNFDLQHSLNMVFLNNREAALLIENPVYDYFSWLLMRRNHYSDIELRHLNPPREGVDRIDKNMLSDFIVGDIDEEAFSSLLLKIDKKRRFNAEMYSIVETFTVVVNDQILKILQTIREHTGGRNLSRDGSTREKLKCMVFETMLQLLEFSNYLCGNLDKLSVTYGYKKPLLSRDLELNTQKISWILKDIVRMEVFSEYNFNVNPNYWKGAWPPENLVNYPPRVQWVRRRY